jgi:hypothetical protein
MSKQKHTNDDDDDIYLSDFQSDKEENDEDDDANEVEEDHNNIFGKWHVDQMICNNKVYSKKAYKNDLKDFAFYRRRILNMTNELLKQQTSFIYNSEEVNNAFLHYAKSCVHHFQEKDTCDLFQEVYSSLEENNNNTIQSVTTENLLSQTEIDNEYLRSVQLFSKNTIDDNELGEDVFCPQQKQINLKDNALKNKGITKKKKKNVST